MAGKKDDEVVVTQELKDILSEEEFDEIIEKEWRVAPLPTEEELAEEQHESPQARSNPNSRANLVQYKRRTKESKEKSAGNLRNKVKKTAEISNSEVEDIKARIMENYPEFIPVDDMFSEAEKRLYYRALDIYLKDFEGEELSGLDVDDIQSLALNKVMIIKMVSLAHAKPRDIVEISSSIQKYKQDTLKIKDQLAVRRRDRVDPRLKDQVTILDLAGDYDAQVRKEKLEDYEKGKEGRDKYRAKMEKVVDEMKDVSIEFDA